MNLAPLFLNHRIISVIITIILALVIITPICGKIFNCGCTWPWFGLDKHCNVHDETQLNQCPWCVSLGLGYLLTIVSLVIGSAFAWAGSQLLPSRINQVLRETRYRFIRAEVLMNIALGVLAFILMTLLNGWLTGLHVY